MGNCYNLVPSRLILASQPEEPKKTQKRYPLAPKPLKSLKPKIIPKATAYSDKNRRHDETDEQFKGRERERKRQLRREGRG